MADTIQSMPRSRGIKYDYDFIKADKSTISFRNETMQIMIANIEQLIMNEYDFEYKFSRDKVYHLMNRPEHANCFIQAKIKIRRAVINN
jgi:hypothetical protein